MPLLTLPSSAVAPLETPGLVPLLAGGGSTLAIARATLAHDEVDAGSLSVEDCYAVALWGIRQFAVSDDAVKLVEVCRAFLETPSRRLRIAEATLAWEFDRQCFLMVKAAYEAPDDEGSDEGGGTAITYSVPDTWTGDDDD